MTKRLIALKLPAEPHALLAMPPSHRSSPLVVDERRTLSPKARQKKTGSWLEISGLLLVGACISYCLIAHDDIKTDFVAKVAVAKQELQVAAGLGPCGIDDTERDAFNAGWEIGNAASK